MSTIKDVLIGPGLLHPVIDTRPMSRLHESVVCTLKNLGVKGIRNFDKKKPREGGGIYLHSPLLPVHTYGVNFQVSHFEFSDFPDFWLLNTPVVQGA